MRDIFNVVQAYLYTNMQRHYKREYRPTIDDNGNEDITMITTAMREHEKSIEFVGNHELLQSLRVTLDERETAILWAKCEKKQIERKYSDNGIAKMRFVSRYKTIAEISIETGYSVKEVRNSLQKIADKLRAICDDNGRVCRVRSNNTSVDPLAWVNTSTETIHDTKAPTKPCTTCTAICTAEHESGLTCSYYKQKK